MKTNRMRHTDEDAGDNGGVMGLLEHLDELRSRLIKACIAIGAGMVAGFVYADPLTRFVQQAMTAALPSTAHLSTGDPAEGFAFYFSIALFTGIVLAAPVVAYQVWRFIAPGLYSSEKRLVLPFICVAIAGTVAGLAFAHYVLFPSTIRFLLSFQYENVESLPRLEKMFDLYENTLLAMVLVFQLPTIVFFLARARVVSARFLARHFKHAFLISFIAAAFLTASPDPGNQTLTAVPLIALYLVSIVIAWLVHPKQDDRNIAEPMLKLVFTAGVIDQALRPARSTRVPGPAEAGFHASRAGGDDTGGAGPSGWRIVR
jgi:sec-independent protein translocase protein TatC